MKFQTIVYRGINRDIIEFIGVVRVGGVLVCGLAGHCAGLATLGIGDPGAINVAKALQSNTTLEWLRLERNHIGEHGAIAIAKALESNTTLQKLLMQEMIVLIYLLEFI